MSAFDDGVLDALDDVIGVVADTDDDGDSDGEPPPLSGLSVPLCTARISLRAVPFGCCKTRIDT